MSTIQGEKILVTGGQGPSGFPPARDLARDNEVYVMARFSDPASQAKLEAAGIKCLRHDLMEPFDDIPDDFSYVYHSAIPNRVAPGFWPSTFDHAADAAGRLAYRCRNAKGFVLVSTASVYDPPPDETPVREDHPLGHHGGQLYGSFSKIAMEAAATFVSRQWGLPMIILRMGSPTGPEGGTMVERLIKIVHDEEIPLHPRKPNCFRPHWDTDLSRMAATALTAGRTPPLIVNFCGDDIVSAEEYCAYMGELVGKTPRIVYRTEGTYTSLVPDTTLMHEVLGTCQVGWKEMCEKLVEMRAWEKGYERHY